MSQNVHKTGADTVKARPFTLDFGLDAEQSGTFESDIELGVVYNSGIHWAVNVTSKHQAQVYSVTYNKGFEGSER